MAHDFGIRNIKKKKYEHYFFGYAGGLMYKAFGEEKHRRLFSGDDGTEIKNKTETEHALDWAIDRFEKMDYPDPNRMDDIKKFRQEMEEDDPSDEYEIWYF